MRGEAGTAVVFERHAGAASAPLAPCYRPRQPHATVLHRVVRENLETFLAEGALRSASGEGYPRYVEKQLRDYVFCGDLSRGFARVRCVACGHELLLPFSCKNRGVCPSCTARRMSDEAAYLVDMVLPEAPYRQWTLTFPFEVRFLMARDHRLITAILGIAMRILFAWQRRQAKRAGHSGAKTAAVAFVQRFGGALNCNVHAHALLPDGVLVLDGSGVYRFVRLPPPEDHDILRLTERLARRVTAYLERCFGSLEPAPGDVLEAAIGEGMQAVPLLAGQPDDDEETPEGRAPEGQDREARGLRRRFLHPRRDGGARAQPRRPREALPLRHAARLLAGPPLALRGRSRPRPAAQTVAPRLAASRCSPSSRSPSCGGSRHSSPRPVPTWSGTMASSHPMPRDATFRPPRP